MFFVFISEQVHFEYHDKIDYHILFSDFSVGWICGNRSRNRQISTMNFHMIFASNFTRLIPIYSTIILPSNFSYIFVTKWMLLVDRKLFVLQIQKDITNGELICSESTKVLLGGIFLQREYLYLFLLSSFTITIVRRLSHIQIEYFLISISEKNLRKYHVTLSSQWEGTLTI